MQERVNLIGGQLHIESTSGGTIVRVSLPLGREEIEKLRILIADDHELVRRGIRGLLRAQSGWKIVGEVKNGREAVEKARKLKPDVSFLISACRIWTGWKPRARSARRTQYGDPRTYDA